MQGDARHLALPDNSVDLICTSPPYFNLRDYRDQDDSLAGQIGGEATWQEYIANLVECAAEWKRVLKPSGSMFVVLGDRYANDAKWGGATSGKHVQGLHGKTGVGRAKTRTGLPAKSLMGLPWRFVFAAQDALGLILRAEICWQKLNSLPESTKDRVTRSHEVILEFGSDEPFDTMMHFTAQGRYFSATDLIREPYELSSLDRNRFPVNSFTPADYSDVTRGVLRDARPGGHEANPLGKMPRSVWRLASAPLNVPERLEHARCCAGRKRRGCTDGLDHHAAFPPELAKRVILGWSPNGICTVCGAGRWPVVAYTGKRGRHPGGGGTYRAMKAPGAKDTNLADAALKFRVIAGYACACTPFTDHPERRRPTVTPTRELRQGQDRRAELGLSRHHGDDWPVRQLVREYDLEAWTPPPARPAVVLDPFGGTGTTALVADVLGRTGVTVDLSADYCSLAAWRTSDPGERARVLGVPKPPPVPPDQLDLFADAS